MQDQQENKQMHPGQICPIQHLSIALFPVGQKTQLWAAVIDGSTLSVSATLQSTKVNLLLCLTASSISKLQISEATESGPMTNRKILAASMSL